MPTPQMHAKQLWAPYLVSAVVLLADVSQVRADGGPASGSSALTEKKKSDKEEKCQAVRQAARTAAIERLISSSLVRHELTLIRIAARPRQVVPPHQQVPPSWIKLIMRLVRSSSPNATTTWFRTTSFRTSTSACCNASANCRASRQQRFTSSARMARNGLSTAGQ